MRLVTFVEIDVPYCALEYSVSPCAAALGVTGDTPCHNGLGTCQDRANFTDEGATFRFAVPTDYLPVDIECIASIKEVRFTPAVISLGENLGQRATLEVVLADHTWSDTGPGRDKYLDDRPYVPSQQGTFWGKFRARHPYLREADVRLIRGDADTQTLDEMETRHFKLDSYDGPRPDRSFRLIAKDPLKYADGDRALAPAPSNGYLADPIDDTETEVDLEPAGIGNAEYPASGYLCLSGNEIVSFTRSGDTLTIVRAQRNTSPRSHAAQDRAQVVLVYDAEDPADIEYDLLTTYARMPPEYIPLSDWQSETATNLGNLFTATIPEPTPVEDLAAEVIEQASLATWWDDIALKLRLQVLRGIPTDSAVFSEENIPEGTFDIRDQPTKRISKVIVYYGQQDPTKRLTDVDNYAAFAVSEDEQATADYGPAVKTIYARFYPTVGGRVFAEKLGETLLARRRDGGRKISFNVHRTSKVIPQLGGGNRINYWPLQDATGARVDVPVQVISLDPGETSYAVEAEEVLFTSPVDATHVVPVDFDLNDFDLREQHDNLYTSADSGTTVVCIVKSGVTIGSSAVGIPAFKRGSWDSGVTVQLVLAGRLQGAGGKGGDGGSNGSAGGVALFTDGPLDVTYQDGAEVFGGAGGGAGVFQAHYSAGGGGGAGTVGGAGGGPGAVNSATHGSPGTANRGGDGGHDGALYGGDGGDPGEAGANSSTHTGGAAGAAIDGLSYISAVGTADIRGSQIN